MANEAVDLARYRAVLEDTKDTDLKSGGGGGTFDPMEARVSRLESDMSEIKSDLTVIRTDLSYMKGRFDGPEGHLKSLPTTLQLLGFVVLIFTAAGLLRYFGH